MSAARFDAKPEQKSAVAAQAEKSMQAVSGHDSAYDNENSPRLTPSGTRHWMQHDLEYSTGVSGATVVTDN